jgi:hypothetical protein
MEFYFDFDIRSWLFGIGANYGCPNIFNGAYLYLGPFTFGLTERGGVMNSPSTQGERTLAEAISAKHKLEASINDEISEYEKLFGVKIDGIWRDRVNSVEFDEFGNVIPGEMKINLSVTI